MDWYGELLFSRMLDAAAAAAADDATTTDDDEMMEEEVEAELLSFIFS